MSPDARSGPTGPMPEVSTGGRSATRSRWTLAIVVAVLVAAALAADPVARRALSDGRVVELGLLQLKLAYNSGVAFSVGNGLPPWVLIAPTGAPDLAGRRQQPAVLIDAHIADAHAGFPGQVVDAVLRHRHPQTIGVDLGRSDDTLTHLLIIDR